MTGKLYPFGYSAPKSVVRISELMTNLDDLATIVDIRHSPYSRWRPEWTRRALERYWGFKYIWRGDWLGNVNYKNDLPIQIAHPYEGIPWLVNFLQKERNIILLCTCSNYELCHRKVVVDLVRQALPEVEVML